MFEWLFGKDNKKLEEETRKSFNAVKEDFKKVGKWVKHLDRQDKQLFEMLNELKEELSSIKKDIRTVEEKVGIEEMVVENKQVFKKMPVLHKQTAVDDVQEHVQTPVQTANFHDILRGLSSNERLLVFTLMQSEMKLSYEDLALLLGKEKSTVRGQINAIKQKSEGLIEEFVEKNGKKRVFVPEEVKEKLSKYAKVRVRGKKKQAENEKSEPVSENS